jgi:16S rRNA (cytidine1402-2'-O)-methyltransferase
MTGRLVLVGTPLGNRGDLSPRAREAIEGADVLLCEDTRSPIRLLGQERRLPPRTSCFVGNEHTRIALLLEHLAAGRTVAYVSEAGMPVWSDPGQLLVAAAIDHGYEVDVIPGPTAAAVALCHSGFSAARVLFLGFLPRDGCERTAALREIAESPATVVAYEAGNRVPALLRDLETALADAHERKLVIARELTKRHQEVVRGTVAQLAATVTEAVRGEVTVVIDVAVQGMIEQSSVDVGRAVFEMMLRDDLKPRVLARELAALVGDDVNAIYARLLQRRERGRK